MKLKLKLPLTFGAVLLIMLVAGFASLLRMDNAITQFETQVSELNRLQVQSLRAEVHFKTQVQEWKNTLLRGFDDQARERFWTAFQKQEAATAQAVRELQEAVQGQPSLAEVEALATQFLAAHASMAEGYRRGFNIFEVSLYDSRSGDQAVSGMDREPARLLVALGEALDAEASRVAQEVAEAGHDAFYVGAGVLALSVLAGIALAGWMSGSIVRPMNAAVQATGEIARGNLVIAVPRGGKDEVGQLLESLAQMQASLVRLIGQVHQSTDSIQVASAEVAAGTRDLATRTEQAASSLEETASSMEELNSTVKQTADAARQANQLASNAAGVAAQGGEVVQQVVSTMSEINQSSQKIADIIGVIDGIAFQTNILALNAAVEAARAGEQGRGFAVVAGEVRTLAQRSAQAAKEIKALIDTSVDKVRGGTALVNTAGSTMQEIVQSVQRVSDIIGEITAATSEQSDGISQVNVAVTQLDQMTQQNAALVEQSQAAAESLSDQARALGVAVGAFNIGGRGPASALALTEPKG
jgi:methyl-accepting chemotaxis protein